MIGAGPAGASMAAVLARLGWAVLVLEQRSALGRKVCGEFISWESRATLTALQLLPAVQAAGPIPLSRAVLTSRSGLTAPFKLARGSLGLSRESLDTALAEAAQVAGAEIMLSTRVLGFERSGSGYVIQARSGGQPIEIRSRALVAACGRSGSRMVPPRRPSKLLGGLIGIKRHYRNVRMPPQVELFFFGGGYVGLAPIEDGLVNLCLLATGTALESSGKSPATLIEQLTERIPRIKARLKAAEPVDASPLAASPVNLWREANPWDSIPCVGDAAAMIPPLVGDGIAAALHSVELCAPLAHAYLCGDHSLEGWQAAYRSQWHAAFDHPLATARKLEGWLGRRTGSDLLLGLGSIFPTALRRVAGLTRTRASQGGQVYSGA